MYKIAICDDINEHLKTAEKMVREFMEYNSLKYEIQLFDKAEFLLSEIEKDRYQPDIAVLDIEMDGEDGISLAKKINISVPQCRIIFLTSYINYAPDVYETDHVWFVVKKQADSHFRPAIEKAVRSLEKGETTVPVILVKDGSAYVAVHIERILFVSKVGRKSYIKCTDGEYYDTRRPGLLISDQLRDQFIRCHQGYWISKRMIRELNHDEFILIDDTRIPVGRTFREQARKEFFDMYRD